ncbi:MAG: amidase [Acidimicrobiales bacterium]|jgi:amidase
MSELWQLSAVDGARGIRDGEFSSSELTTSVVDRVRATNGHLNSITIDLTELALAEAETADAAVARGDELGPLHGVPATIKENVDMAGLPNTNGVPAFAELMATEDAPLVRNLRNAGAIIIGRTNTPEFSMRGTTDNPLRGRTFNPWEDQNSPGGSSGGAGSACAAGMGPLHHGNDIGGSLRFPAFANGVTTVKPTSFRVPVFNSSAVAERGPLSQTMSVQGIIARHAADVRLATSVMIAPDPRDPNSPPVPWNGPDLGGLPKVAVTTESHGYDIHPDLVAMVRRAADQLRDAGYEVVEVDPPPVIEPAREWFRAGTTEMEATIDAAIKDHGSTTINDIFGWYYEMSELLDRDGYIKAVGDRTRLLRNWNLFLAEYPLVITPFLMRPMYDWDYDSRGLAEVKDLFDSAVYSTGINYLGLPAGVIGMDLVEARPAAIQIVGQRYREDIICDALEAIEDRNGVLVQQLWDRE